MTMVDSASGVDQDWLERIKAIAVFRLNILFIFHKGNLFHIVAHTYNTYIA